LISVMRIELLQASQQNFKKSVLVLGA